MVQFDIIYYLQISTDGGTTWTTVDSGTFNNLNTGIIGTLTHDISVDLKNVSAEAQSIQYRIMVDNPEPGVGGGDITVTDNAQYTYDIYQRVYFNGVPEGV